MKNKAFRLLTAATIIIGAVNLLVSVFYIIGLPEKVPLHYNAAGVCDGYGSKWFTLFFPLIILLINPIGLFITSKSKSLEKNMKPLVISILFIEFYLIAMEWVLLITMKSETKLGDKMSLNVSLIVPAIISILFIAMGNYMPTIRQNKHLGVKLPWTLKNERCWDVTHRFTGKVWVAAGILTLSFIAVIKLIGVDNPTVFIMLTLVPISLAIIIPTIYSYNHRND